MESIKVGNCYLQKNLQNQFIVASVVSGFSPRGWAICKVWTTDGYVTDPEYPLHFLDDVDEFVETDFDRAISQLVPINSPVVTISVYSSHFDSC